MLKQLGAKTIQNRLCGLSITPEGTFTHFWSFNLERFLRTKQRKAFPSHMQHFAILEHYPRPPGRVESATVFSLWTFPGPRNASIMQRALALPSESHDWWSKCCLVPILDLQACQPLVPHQFPIWCPQHPFTLVPLGAAGNICPVSKFRNTNQISR